MDRRTFLCGLTLGPLAAPLAAEAQPAGKIPRIGFLSLSSPEAVAPRIEAFRQGLRQLGWVESQNVTIEYRYAEGKVERLPTLAAELVGLRIDLLVVGGITASHAAKQATTSLPIVFIGAGEPVTTGLVTSLARPGGNITGIASLVPELVAKHLELLKEAIPKMRRVAVLLNPTNPTSPLAVKYAETAAVALGLRLQVSEVRRLADFEHAFAVIARDRPDALYVPGDPVVILHLSRVVDFAAKSRLPAMYPVREFADAGGLMAYGANLSEMYRQAAVYADKILKGARPGELPIEQPTKFELIINLKTAKALGLTIPPSLLQRADQVIQ
jgi:putative ABC transport system substrate-binding protein